MPKVTGMLFTGEMVRALLREIEVPGTGKTQTRRPMKPQPPEDANLIRYNGHACLTDELKGKASWFIPEAGDLIYVRETFGHEIRSLGGTPHEQLAYRASHPDAVRCYSATGSAIAMKWTPSIHMPRHASRITLEITGVRVERVQDITKANALAEGVNQRLVGGRVPPNPKRVFRDLWNSIYSAGGLGWDANPWVWVYEFRPIIANVNDLLKQREAE